VLGLSSAMALPTVPPIVALFTVSNPPILVEEASFFDLFCPVCGWQETLRDKKAMYEHQRSKKEDQDTCRVGLREARKLRTVSKDGCDGHVQKEELSVTIMQSCCPRCKFLGSQLV
jgi:hypothetical protein